VALAGNEAASDAGGFQSWAAASVARSAHRLPGGWRRFPDSRAHPAACPGGSGRESGIAAGDAPCLHASPPDGGDRYSPVVGCGRRAV